MNREACSLLCSGDYLAASKVLANALPLLRDIQVKHVTGCIPFSTPEEQLLVKPMRINPLEQQCSSFRIYDFALHVHGNGTETSNPIGSTYIPMEWRPAIRLSLYVLQAINAPQLHRQPATVWCVKSH